MEMEKEEVEKMVAQAVTAAITPIISTLTAIAPALVANLQKPKTEEELQQEAKDAEHEAFVKAMKEGASPSKHNNYHGANIQEI